MNRLFKASVADNKQIKKDHYLLTLHPLKKIKQPKPGNFFMLSVDNGPDPLLKRPFSIHRIIGDDLQVLYRTTGRGTTLLSKKKHGDILDVVGPLGNGFPPPKKDDKIILVAGGVGIAPVFMLAEAVKDRKPVLFYGAKTRDQLLRLNELKSLGIKPVIATDDGTLGHKGVITELLDNFLKQSSNPETHQCLYACGPEPMLKALSHITGKFNIKAYAALEQNMACGIGTCLGCVVKTKNGLRRVCKEGPVFPVEDIIWEQ